MTHYQNKALRQVQVRIRRQDGTCRVSVDDLDQARWLLDRLTESFVFKTCEPVLEDEVSGCCIFRVACNSQTSLSRLNSLLAAISEVRLSNDAG